MNIGEAIRNNRQKKGIKGKELAALCGITAAYLSQIETGKKDPTLATLRAISRELKIPLPILFLLAIDADDIEPSKYEAFLKLVLPMVEMIKAFFQLNVG